MIVGVPRETYPDERRVALVPSSANALKKKGLDVLVESEAGISAGFLDADYEKRHYGKGKKHFKKKDSKEKSILFIVYSFAL